MGNTYNVSHCYVIYALFAQVGSQVTSSQSSEGDLQNSNDCPANRRQHLYHMIRENPVHAKVQDARYAARQWRYYRA